MDRVILCKGLFEVASEMNLSKSQKHLVTIDPVAIDLVATDLVTIDHATIDLVTIDL